jgi:methionine-rich copper-binding protein CopC
MRRTIAAAAMAAAVLAVFSAGTASGHTGVERYVPGEGATVSTPVKVVGLRFEGPIVTGALTLTTASGRTITPREQGVVSHDTYLRMVLRSPLAAGSYRAAWRVRFEDGHRRQDAWTFRVD